MKDLTDFFAELPRLLGWDAECYEEPITPEKAMETKVDCSRGKVSGLDDLPCVLYYSVSGLFGCLLACVYKNWQQNGLIPIFVRQGVVMLIRKDPSKGGLYR